MIGGGREGGLSVSALKDLNGEAGMHREGGGNVDCSYKGAYCL